MGHSTMEEAVEETQRCWMYMPPLLKNTCALVIRGVKSESERFAGAVDTYCIEALMQDGKAGRYIAFPGSKNFAKAFEVKFQIKKNKQEYVLGHQLGCEYTFDWCFGDGA